MKYSKENPPIVCLMTQSTCYQGTTEMKPLGVLWHSTAANNPRISRYVQPDDDAPNRDEMIRLLGTNQYKNDWNHIYLRAGVTAFVGKLASGEIASVQTLEWTQSPWGCGAGSKGTCNYGWMQFEICEDNLKSKEYFDAVYNEACELTAYYCKMFDLDPHGTVMFNGVEVPVILDHALSHKLKLGSNHGDVQHWFKKYNKTLDDVRNDVAKLLAEDKAEEVKPAPEAKPVTPNPAPTKQIYRVRKSWEDAKSQIGAYENLDYAKEKSYNAGPEYKVYDSDGYQVFPEEKEEFKSYLVYVTAGTLNYRQGPGITYKKKGEVKKGEVYTIVQESGKWGKLKSGENWIYLPYTKKI